jgi:hypothetical protein
MRSFDAGAVSVVVSVVVSAVVGSAGSGPAPDDSAPPHPLSSATLAATVRTPYRPAFMDGT